MNICKTLQVQILEVSTVLKAGNMKTVKLEMHQNLKLCKLTTMKGGAFNVSDFCLGLWIIHVEVEFMEFKGLFRGYAN